MKKVLLHIAAVLSLAVLGFAILHYRSTIMLPIQSGFTSRRVASACMSGHYLLLLAAYFFAIRSLKKRESKGLWVYSLLVLLFFGLYLYYVGFRLRYTNVITIDSILSVPCVFFFAAPPLLIPLMPLGQKGRWALPAALFGLLALSFGIMTWGWDQIYNWDRKAALLFDPTCWTNKVFVSDAYHDYSDGMLLTVDNEGKMYAYVSESPTTVVSRDKGRRPTEVFSVHREGNEFVFVKDFYADRAQTQPVLSIPCMRGHIWDDGEDGYCVDMAYEKNPLFTKDELWGLYCRLAFTDRTDVGVEDLLEGCCPEDWPGVEWDMLDERFVVDEEHRLWNENGMTLLWTYTDIRFILAKRQEGADGVTYEPWACGRKKVGRGIYDIRTMGTDAWWNGTGTLVYTDYDSQNKGVIWPGEPLDLVKDTYVAESWTEVLLQKGFAASLCLLERGGQRLLLFHAEADDLYSWADWSDEFDPEEQLVTGYALFAPDGVLQAWGGLVPVAADQTETFLSQRNTRAKIGSFGYINWQDSWTARTRLTTDGRLILQNEAGEWISIQLHELMEG